MRDPPGLHHIDAFGQELCRRLQPELGRGDRKKVSSVRVAQRREIFGLIFFKIFQNDLNFSLQNLMVFCWATKKQGEIG